MTQTDKAQSLWNQLVGGELCAVVFVRDYLQLQFDGPRVDAYSTVITVHANGTTANFGEAAFANLVLSLIGRVVSAVNVVDDESFKIVFVDENEIDISLRSRDYRGPEAIGVRGRNGELAYF